MKKWQERIKTKVREKYGYEDDVLLAALTGVLIGATFTALSYRMMMTNRIMIDPRHVWVPAHVLDAERGVPFVLVSDHPALPEPVSVVTIDPSVTVSNRPL